MDIILERARYFFTHINAIFSCGLGMLCVCLMLNLPLANASTPSKTVSEYTIAAPNTPSKTVDTETTNAGHVTVKKPALWSAIPFLLLLVLIATGPLFFERLWLRYYPAVAIILAGIVICYYLLVLKDFTHPIHSLTEYFSFISLLAALFIISGGIHIHVDRAAKPITNVVLLVLGALAANIVGTTGASMLLIRPFIKLNEGRIKAYHIIFFIFIVSNVGGCLTPIGDPPLFLGFLKGIPFAWTLKHLWGPWLFGVGLLSSIFFFIDVRNNAVAPIHEAFTGKVKITGARNVFFLLIIIGAVFIDPDIIPLPSYLYINYHGDKLSYLREVIMLLTAGVAYFTSKQKSLERNDFNFEPIIEVALLFVGIFATMMPALQLIGTFAYNNADVVNTNTLYWATGGLSGVLDNAPTYLNFLSAAMGKMEMNIDQKQQVRDFAAGVMDGDLQSYLYLKAISLAAVFFGAFTYIGNAPNFMVKSIAEQNGIDMPSFVVYIVKYAIPILLPVLLLTWVVFFVIL